MVAKYLTSLAATVFAAAFLFSLLPFATRSEVLAGTTVDEVLHYEFTVDADSSSTYKVSPATAQFLNDNIRFPTDGPVRVVSSKVQITPKKVTWTENKKHITSTGAALDAQVQWQAPSDAANGAHSNIYLLFPEMAAFEKKLPTFHSGAYQKDDQDRTVVREVTTYRTTFLLTVARFMFALAAGLPIGIILHVIAWTFVVIREKKQWIAALPAQGPGWPQTFYPDPIAEWTIWQFILGMGAFVASMLAGFSVADGFMSSSFVPVIYWVLGVGAAAALIGVYFTRKYLLTIRVDGSSLTYARGRGDLQWSTVGWDEISEYRERSRTSRGNTTYWLELAFKDQRKGLKITPSIVGYQELRAILNRVFGR